MTVTVTKTISIEISEGDVKRAIDELPIIRRINLVGYILNNLSLDQVAQLDPTIIKILSEYLDTQSKVYAPKEAVAA